MELAQWFLIGVLFSGIVMGLSYLSMVARLAWWGWVGMIGGAFALLFGLGWAGASFLEGIAQSGAMGLLFFSGSGVLVMLLSWRYGRRGDRIRQPDGRHAQHGSVESGRPR